MEILIEGQKLEIDLQADKPITLGQIITEIEDYLITIRKIPTNVRLNGVTYNAENDKDKAERCTLASSDKIEVDSITLESFMISQLSSISVAQENLVQGIQSFSKQLEAKKVSAEDASILEELKSFFEFWTSLYRIFPEVAENIQFEQQSFPEWLSSLSKKLNQVVEAIQKPDFILAADLLRFEFVPALQTVKLFIQPFQESLRAVEQQRQEPACTPDSTAQ
jgi:hypothetical protein